MRIIFKNLRTFFCYQLFFVALLILVMSNHAGAKNLVYDNNWAYLADTVMGGVSQGDAEFSAGALRLTGNVSTKNNGGFIQVRTRVDPSDIGSKTGIRIKVKGNGEIYYLHIRNASARLPWHYYTVDFETTEKWKEITIPFEDFEKSATFMPKKLKADTIRTIGLVAYGKDHNADVSISNLEFY
jgi:hypothetical protein